MLKCKSSRKGGLMHPRKTVVGLIIIDNHRSKSPIDSNLYSLYTRAKQQAYCPFSYTATEIRQTLQYMHTFRWRGGRSPNEYLLLFHFGCSQGAFDSVSPTIVSYIDFAVGRSYHFLLSISVCIIYFLTQL